MFSPSATSADINAVVGASKFRGTKGDSDSVAEESAENHSIYVFPGVEITASSNIHVLAIFDPSATSADINAVVGASKFRGTKIGRAHV